MRHVYNNLDVKDLTDVEPMEDALAKVVDEVASDSQTEPKQYLNDSIAPEGGE